MIRRGMQYADDGTMGLPQLHFEPFYEKKREKGVEDEDVIASSLGGNEMFSIPPPVS